MSSRVSRSKKKKPLEDGILISRKAFLSAIQLTSVILQAMGEEFENLRASKEMDPKMRKALMQLTSAHLQNVSGLSHALQCSVMDPLDPEGTKPQALN